MSRFSGIGFIFIFAIFQGYSVKANGQPSAKELISQLEKASGGLQRLYSLRDVEFTYSYENLKSGAKDYSLERYIFDGEHSWARYDIHQINVMADKKGPVVQSLVNGKAQVSLSGKVLTDPKQIATAKFLREANFFWFTMMFKLSDANAIKKYQGQESVGGVNYHKVAISYDSKDTGKAQNDGYIVYINPKTSLVDRFLFSLPVRGIMAPIILMEVSYSRHEGLMLPTKRAIYFPGKSGKFDAKPGTQQITRNIKFNNGFSVKDFSIQ